MTVFTSRWLTYPTDTDETDTTGCVSSGSSKTVGVGEKSSRASTQSISNEAGGGGGGEKSIQTLDNGTAETDRTLEEDVSLLWQDLRLHLDDDGPDTSGPASDRTGLPVPSGCIGPIACRVLGGCGRATCGATADISRSASREEDDRAA